MSLDVNFSFFASANGIFSSSILSGLFVEFAFCLVSVSVVDYRYWEDFKLDL